MTASFHDPSKSEYKGRYGEVLYEKGMETQRRLALVREMERERRLQNDADLTFRPQLSANSQVRLLPCPLGGCLLVCVRVCVCEFV